MLIERPPRLFRLFFPGAKFRLPSPGEKCVYLTFDDGPVPDITPWVLDTLDRYNVKATFFMVGQNVQRYPHLLEDVRKRGHSVGNHTLHHMQSLSSSARAYFRDAIYGQRLTGSKIFRPPHGLMKFGQLRTMLRHYDIVMFDLVTRDYDSALTPEDVAGNVRNYARNGSIIVFHDSLKSFPRLESALPQSIEWLRSQGYVFKTL